jgi:hypothetical protein
MSDDLPCGWPYLRQEFQDTQTLEGIVDGIGLRAVLMISYAKANHDWQDYKLAREWQTAGNKLGQWAKLIGPRQ